MEGELIFLSLEDWLYWVAEKEKLFFCGTCAAAVDILPLSIS
jgi:hypothetical protein